MKNIVFIMLAFCVFACNSRETKVDKSQLLGKDYRLFQDTPAWELAKAVEDADIKKIAEITKKDKSLLNFQEPKFGSTLLKLTLFRHEYDIAKYLIELGTDVNIYDKYNGSSAIIVACDYKDVNVNIVNTLIEYGANVNDVEVGKRPEGNTTRDTPLIKASRAGNLPLVSFLISKGANVNYKSEYGATALESAFMVNNYDIVIYLLKNGSKPNEVLFNRPNENKNYTIVDVLREDVFELNSPEYKFKKEIIEILKTKGIDYAKVPIPDYVIKKAKEKYPKDWEEYLKKY